LSQINGNGKDSLKLFPAQELRIAIQQSLSMLGQSLTESLIEDLKKNGIELDTKQLHILLISWNNNSDA
jgi:hypothetical protein